MPKIKVYNLSRRGVGEMELSDVVFDAKVNESLFYDVLKAQLASHRRGTAASKNRAEVSATSRKLYRQKGTGNARHGSKRAPIFVGGGAAHGPRPRSFAYRPPRKMRLGALRGALTLKLKEGRLLVVQDFELEEIKTRKLAAVLEKLEVVDSALIVDAKDNEKLRLSARNLQNYSVLPPEGVNLYDLLRHEHLVLTQGAVEALETRCGPNGAKSGAAAATSAGQIETDAAGETMAQPEAVAETKSEAEAEPKAVAKAEPAEAEKPKPASKKRSKVRSKPEAVAEPESDSASESEPASVTASAPEPVSEPKEEKPRPASEKRSRTRSEAESAPEPEPESEPASEAVAEPASETETELRTEPASEAVAEPASGPGPGSEPEPEAEAEAVKASKKQSGTLPDQDQET